MAKEHLYEELFERQEGACAICNLELSDRYMTQIDRIIPGKEGGKYVLENCQLIHLKCDWEKEGNAPNSPHPELAAVYRTYKMWQDEHGRMDRKIRAYSGDLQGTTRSPYIDAYTLAELVAFRDVFEQRKKEAEKKLKGMVRGIPFTKVITDAPGGGELVAAFLLSKVDIRKADTVSALWKYFGYDPTEKYNPGKGRMKSNLYAGLSITLIRKDGPYRQDYDRFRSRDLGHGQALLRVIKLWLSHLWDQWRRFEGLPVSEPYAHAQLGHAGFVSAEMRGWNYSD